MSQGPAEDNRRRVFAKRFRTELCRGFLATGACAYHSKCMFAHGEAELRTEQQNLDDGLVCESAIRAWKKQHRNRELRGAPPAAEVHHERTGSAEERGSSNRSGCGCPQRYRRDPYAFVNVIVCCS